MKYVILIEIFIFLIGSYFICLSNYHELGFLVCLLAILLSQIITLLRYILYGRD